MKSLKSLLSIFLLSASCLTVHAQDSLQQKFDVLLENSESYQQYKVIPKEDLASFWKEVMDSVRASGEQIGDLQEALDAEKDQSSEVSASLEQVKKELQVSQELSDTVSFIGFDLSEASYHVIVWMLIAVLAGLAVFGYVLFLRANSVTSRAKKELSQLSQDFEDHKNKSREQQIKLKRELQTAINQLNEKR